MILKTGNGLESTNSKIEAQETQLDMKSNQINRSISSNESTDSRVKTLVYLIIDFVLLIPIFTLFQNYISFINQASVAIILILMAFLLIIDRLSGRFVFGFIVVLFLTVFSFLQDHLNTYSLNLVAYLPVMFLFYSLLVRKKALFSSYISERKKYIALIVLLWFLVVAINLAIPSSYKFIWGDGLYFHVFSQNIFRVGPTALFIMALILLLSKLYNKKALIALDVLPLFCFFTGGSRTYLFVGLCALAFSILLIFGKKVFYLSLIPLVAISVIAIMNSSMMDKIISTTSDDYYYGGALGAFTNGRSYFWIADLKAFFSQGIMSQLFGCGFNFVYDVNEAAMNAFIWAHNDFIQMLCNYGYCGLVFYIYLMYVLFHTFKPAKHNILVFFFLFIIWFFNAFFNMFFTYFCSMLSFPFFAVAYQKYTPYLTINHSYNKDE